MTEMLDGQNIFDLRVIIDISKPLRRVVQFVNREGVSSVRAIKYERFPTFFL